MPTSKLDRLNKLFEGQERIARPDPDKPHISDLDFMPKTAKEQSSAISLVDQTPWKVPDVAQVPRQLPPPPPSTGRDLDLISSSEDDEYLAAFSSKPKSKTTIKVLPKGKSKHDARDDLWGAQDPMESDDLRVQDVDGNELTAHFCPLSLVAKFPYKYMVDTNDRVSKHFFAANKFYQRQWDIYYIDPLGSLTAKPILLLPLQQVQTLIDDINKAFKSEIQCPIHPFVVSFFDDGTPQPTRLGISRSRDDLENMQASIPCVPDDYAELPEDLSLELLPSAIAPTSGTAKKPTERSYADFKTKMERIVEATTKSKQIARKKKNEDRFFRQQDWAKNLKRAQRYFGLRPKVTKMPLPDPAATWYEQQLRQVEDLRKCGILLDPLDVNKPLPHLFENDVVFVCIDVEAYERDNRKITEIGVSTLDTLDMVGIAPGEGGENWIPHIRSRHIRIRGREHLENKDFCPGDANSFQFGDSEFVHLKDAAEVVDQCFEYPFSARCKKRTETNLLPTFTPSEEPVVAELAALATLGRVPTTEIDSVEKINVVDPGNAAQDAANKAAIPHILHGDPAHSAGSSGECVRAQEGPEKRNVIFVGHDIRNEFEYLRELGSQIFAPSRGTYPIAAMEVNANGTGRSGTLTSILEALDTAVLNRVLLKETQNCSLGKIMLGLGKTAWHLHNAGNDARYTLEALIGICIKARMDEDQVNVTGSGSIMKHNLRNVQWKDEVEKRVQERAKAVEQDIRDESKGWEKATTLPVELVKEIHTMSIASGDRTKLEMEGHSPETKKDLYPNLTERSDHSNSVVYRDPAATDGAYEIKSDHVDGGIPEADAMAKMMKTGKEGKKRPSR